MKKEKKDKNFIKKPVYPGGMEALRAFISAELKYPEAALKNKIQGTVKIKYQVDYRGNVTECKVVKRLGYGCDEEAERIVKRFKFNVAKNKAGKILFNKTINIHFHYKEQKKKMAESAVHYQYNVSSSEKEEKVPSTAYNYSIKW